MEERKGTVSGDRTPFRPTIAPDSRFIRPCKTRAVIVALTTQRNALQMLADRVRVIVEYLSALSQDKVRRDDETLRMIASLAGTVPAAAARRRFRSERLATRPCARWEGESSSSSL